MEIVRFAMKSKRDRESGEAMLLFSIDLASGDSPSAVLHQVKRWHEYLER
jgi:hypothetical protein